MRLFAEVFEEHELNNHIKTCIRQILLLNVARNYIFEKEAKNKLNR